LTPPARDRIHHRDCGAVEPQSLNKGESRYGQEEKEGDEEEVAFGPRERTGGGAARLPRCFFFAFGLSS